VSPSEILEFWFADTLTSGPYSGTHSQLWFRKDADFDAEIERRFGSLPEAALRGELDAWRDEPASTLALVIVCDQFPRNLYRGSARAFEFDPFAREVACEAIDKGLDEQLHPIQAVFLYLPLEHSEDVALHDRCLQLFERLEERAPAALRPRIESFCGYARSHGEIIRRFGRYPHRNALLDRAPTPEEAAYLDSGGETFS